MNVIDRLLFIGIKGRALALSRETGDIVWETHLKSSGFVNVVLDGGDLLATTAGEIWCLDPITGAVRWNNPLRGMGFGLVTVASSNSVAAMEEQMDEDARSSSNLASTPAQTPGM